VEPAAKLDELTDTALMAGPLSRRKLAMVLKSGAKRPVSHIRLDIALGLPFKAAAGLDPIKIAVEVDLRSVDG